MNKPRPADQRITTPLQLGELLRRRRKARKLTQHDIAAKLGVSQGRVSSLEDDPARLSVARLLTLANVLGLEFVLRERADRPKDAEW